MLFVFVSLISTGKSRAKQQSVFFSSVPVVKNNVCVCVCIFLTLILICTINGSISLQLSVLFSGHNHSAGTKDPKHQEQPKSRLLIWSHQLQHWTDTSYKALCNDARYCVNCGFFFFSYFVFKFEFCLLKLRVTCFSLQTGIFQAAVGDHFTWSWQSKTSIMTTCLTTHIAEDFV